MDLKTKKQKKILYTTRTFIKNGPLHAPADLVRSSKAFKSPGSRASQCRQITSNSPLMPRYVPAGGGGGVRGFILTGA